MQKTLERKQAKNLLQILILREFSRITGSIIVYVLIWWIIFFSVLPVGIQSKKEKFQEKIEGIDPGAPNNPKIAKNF